MTKPSSKIQAAGAAGAVTIVLVWALAQAGVELPPEVASAITTIVATAAGYATRNQPPA